MIVRKAIGSDAKKIAENNMFLAEETEGRKIESNVAIEGSEQVLSEKQNGFYLVAEHKKEIIGQIFITDEWSDWRNQSIWWMHRIYVKKTWRKKGVLKSLLRKAKEKANEENVYALRLYMIQKNQKAVSIYKRLGFTDTAFTILEHK
ncbi:MAG: GNAT family N-acetyltransferase [Candidatus Thermoplasmatota archaeon]|nr:GNAT family N-acetyltransferase [Candidatus Thermoplasmatota archaeon]